MGGWLTFHLESFRPVQLSQPRSTRKLSWSSLGCICRRSWIGTFSAPKGLLVRAGPVGSHDCCWNGWGTTILTRFTTFKEGTTYPRSIWCSLGPFNECSSTLKMEPGRPYSLPRTYLFCLSEVCSDLFIFISSLKPLDFGAIIWCISLRKYSLSIHFERCHQVFPANPYTIRT